METAMQVPPTDIFRRIVFLSLLLGLSACAVMDKSDCINANWQGLGKKDALNGEYIFSARAQSCKEHGLAADQSAYERGVQEGLIGFCTAASGRHHGQNGGVYRRGFCPANTESEFLFGYTPAQQKYRFRQKVSELQSQIAAADDFLREEARKPARNDWEIARRTAERKRLKEELRMHMYLRVLD